MKPFQFRLASLLSLRDAERDAKRDDLTAALAEHDRVLAGRDAVERKLAVHQAEQRSLRAANRATLDVLMHAQRYAACLRNELGEWYAAEHQAVTEVIRCQEALTQTEREVEVLEKLRERQRARYRVDFARAEVKQFDEVAAQRFARTQAPAARPA